LNYLPGLLNYYYYYFIFIYKKIKLEIVLDFSSYSVGGVTASSHRGKNYIHIGLFEDPVQSSSSKTPT
jgi:hypothetical protein